MAYLTVAEIMTKKVESITPEKSIFDVVQFLKEKNIGAIVVAENDRLLGMFTERDLITKVISESIDTKKTPVSEVMTHPVLTIPEDYLLQDAYIMMNDHHIRHIPVINTNGDLVGMLGSRDLMQALMQEMIESFMKEEIAS